MKKFNISLTNTLTNKQEQFVPLKDQEVTMYVCGITPYDYAHLGHGRCYVTFDVLYRLLNLFNYKVTYCRNFTDIDDKLIKRAQAELNDPTQYSVIASKFIKAYHEDMSKLNCLNPQFEPRVTKHIPQIIEFIQGLINKGKAYVTNNGVYYSVDSFKDYGKLSKRNLQDLKAGARIEIRQDKKSPLDFALWKLVDSAPGWDSPWGYGRPGWHIECSALAKEYLGETIDIHGGGMDLIFPHHENEIAQSSGLFNKEFAKYWLHNAFVTIDKEKMSKSLGNFFTLRQLFEKFDPMVIRYYFLVHHYRNPIDFSLQDLEATQKSYEHIIKIFQNIKAIDFKEICLEQLPIIEKLLKALCDDLNIARFFGIIFENSKELENNSTQSEIAKVLIQQVLGLTLEQLPEKKVEITPEIQELINKRKEARKAKDWATADKIRDKLAELGIETHDKKIK